MLKDREKLQRDEGKAAHLILVGEGADSPPSPQFNLLHGWKIETSL